jgi:hypothetical protein
MNMKIAYKLDSNGFYLEDVILSDNEGIPSDCTNIKTPDGLYKARFVNGAWVEGMAQADILADAKAAKKAQLSASFDATMASGFTSSALGVSHNYPSDLQAMIFFNATMNRFGNDSTFTTVNQKTLDAGYLAHTKAQFFQVFNDGHAFGVAQDTKLANLKAQVDAATTVSAVNAITW